MSSNESQYVIADDCKIDLKNRYFAALLAFLLPGAGHFYQGRKHKAYMFAVCILGLFFGGLYLGNGRVVYGAWNPDDYRIQFPAQLCVGIPSFPAVVQLMKGNTAKTILDNSRGIDDAVRPKWIWSEFMAPPRDATVLDSWHLNASAGFELGSLFTAVAGLLNLLVIFDAFGGPMPMPVVEAKKKS